MRRPVVLIVRDGWGMTDVVDGNAVLAADTPNVDGYCAEFPRTFLDCSGEAVGLPEGYQGSSEVGHLNMGAGRIVIQELKRIDDSLKAGEFFNQENWRQLINNWRANQSRLHLMGLIQDEGVHAHQDHLFQMLRRARSEYPDGQIVVHAFLDGRDTPPQSCLGYLADLTDVMAQAGNCRVGTFMGRYYAMDRSENWTLTDRAFACIVDADGLACDSLEDAIRASYENDKTPDGVDMFDEYILPHVLGDYDGVKDGDSVLHTNYRQDRAIQLSKAFAAADYPGHLPRRPKVVYMGLTRYYNEFAGYLMEPIDSGGGLTNLLGEIVSAAGLKQLRIAETQKFRHVTSFFNGKSTDPYPGEAQVEVTSELDPSSFASHPEMEACAVTERLLSLCAEESYDFVAVNFANGDMVGHTGDFNAARRAVEVVDACVGRVVTFFLERDAHILITADHGNAEEMIDHKRNAPKTSHTVNPVDLIYVARDARGKRLAAHGKLSDVAPTVLELLGLPIPAEMTAESLLAGVAE